VLKVRTELYRIGTDSEFSYHSELGPSSGSESKSDLDLSRMKTNTYSQIHKFHNAYLGKDSFQYPEPITVYLDSVIYYYRGHAALRKKFF